MIWATRFWFIVFTPFIYLGFIMCLAVIRLFKVAQQLNQDTDHFIGLVKKYWPK